MIRRVYEQSVSCPLLSEVIVATDDITIEKHINLFGGRVMMTAGDHASGTERCNEVCSKLIAEGRTFDAVINIQGDEPYIHPEQIGEVAAEFDREEVQIVSLMKQISNTADLMNPNVVKVVAGSDGTALYFSRAAIPFVRGLESSQWLEKHTFFKHVGIYGYRVNVLNEIVNLPQSVIERTESLEQLRWLDHGFRIRMKETRWESVAIDSPADLLKLTNNS